MAHLEQEQPAPDVPPHRPRPVLRCWPLIWPPTRTPAAAPTADSPGCRPRDEQYSLPVDEELKATVLRLTSCGRPHMRAWHLSWLAVFIAFISTFSPAALAPILQDEVDLTSADLTNANIASVAGAVVFRILIGSMVDVCGPCFMASLVLLCTAPAVFCLAVMTDAASLLVLRLVVGLSLCTFVVGQAWATAMFSARIVGTATALAAGWGNAGGGVALFMMPLVVAALKAAGVGAQAWRWAFFVPATMQVLVGVLVLVASDDSPQGSYTWGYRGSPSGASGSSAAFMQLLRGPWQWLVERSYRLRARLQPQQQAEVEVGSSQRKCLDLDLDSAMSVRGMLPHAGAAATAAAADMDVDAAVSCDMLHSYPGLQLVPGQDPAVPGFGPPGLMVRRAADPRGNIAAALLNYRTYILAVAYAISLGVELTVNNILVKYMFDHFGLELASAGALAAVFGLMNIFTRVTGGLGSDMAARVWGMRGRLWVLWLTLVLGGVFCLLLGASHERLPATVATLVLFSVFCQAACGAVFSVVPFVSRRANGLVTGIVAAGGNLGALVCQAAFFGYSDITPYQGLYWMGLAVLILSCGVFFMYFPMWGGMVWRAKPGATEEAYYLAEFSREERARGAHLSSLAFAHETRSNRGVRLPVAAAGGGSRPAVAAQPP